MGKCVHTHLAVLWNPLKTTIDIKNIQAQKRNFQNSLSRKAKKRLIALIGYKPLHFKFETRFYLTADRSKVKNTNPGASQIMKQWREERNTELKEFNKSSALPAAEALQKDLQKNKADIAALLRSKAAL